MQFDTSGLQLQSIAGNSGKAFKGQRSDGTPVFVKYEMPPIVSVLAREQITPPILSANREAGMGHRVEQEWLNGRTLERQDMGSKQVRQILGAGPNLYLAEAGAQLAYDRVDWRAPCVLVVGGEASGASAAARAAATEIAIPMASGVESLNAAVAGSIILFEAARQRRARTTQLC